MLEKPKASNVAMAVFMALTAIPLAGAVSSLSSLFFSDLAVEGITEITSSVGSLPVALAVTALVPAVFEELAFRGVILYGYRNVGVHKAALLNGFFFGMIHMNFRQFFYAFMLGVLLAYVVYISRSLVLGMVMHFTVNATSVVLTYALAAIEDVPEAALETSTAGDGVFSPGYILYVLIFTLIFVQIFRRFKRRNSADNSGEPSAVQKEKILSVPFFASIAVFVIVAVLIELATQNRL